MKDRDHYFWKAKEEGFASRAAYKIQEIQKTQRFLRPGDKVIELGAAPGGWTEVIAPLLGPNGKLFCVDLQPMNVKNFGNTEFLLGDFTDVEVLEALRAQVEGLVDVVLSDAAPSTSGIHFRDAALSADLCMNALSVAQEFLKPGGALLCKIFAGDENEFLKACRENFEEVKRLKPDASKKKSREFYVLSRGFGK